MTLQSDETRFILVRHGETDANRLGYVGGSTDDALTERGHEQAGKVATHLGDTLDMVHALYTSPLKRAQETAGYIGGALDHQPSIIDDLQEWHAGDWEQLEYSVIPQQPEFRQEALVEADFAPPNGESLGSVQKRVVAVLKRLHEQHQGEHIVVVSHGSALALALAELVNDDLGAWLNYRLENCSVTEFIHGPAPRLIEANHVEHL